MLALKKNLAAGKFKTCERPLHVRFFAFFASFLFSEVIRAALFPFHGSCMAKDRRKLVLIPEFFSGNFCTFTECEMLAKI